MRLSFYSVLIVVTFALNSISLAGAKAPTQIDNVFPDSVVNLHDGETTARYLKEDQHEVDALPEGGSEERGLVGAFKNLRDVGIFKKADKFKSEDAAGKLKSEGAAEKLKFEGAADKLKSEDAVKWQSVAEKLQAGGKFKTDKARVQKVFSKLKAEGKIDEAGVEKLTKISEKAAQELEKNPKKWLTVENAVQVAYGVVITSLIITAISVGIVTSGILKL